MTGLSRSLIAALALHLFFVIGVAQEKSRAVKTAPLGLMLLASADADAASGDVILKWSLKNTSDRDISLPDVNVFLDHKLIVKDQKNRAVPLTRAGQDASAAAYFTSSRRTTVLGPGQAVTKELKISDFFNMEAKGGYTIVVERRVPSIEGKAVKTIRSNVVKVRIV